MKPSGKNSFPHLKLFKLKHQWLCPQTLATVLEWNHSRCFLLLWPSSTPPRNQALRLLLRKFKVMLNPRQHQTSQRDPMVHCQSLKDGSGKYYLVCLHPVFKVHCMPTKLKDLNHTTLDTMIFYHGRFANGCIPSVNAEGQI